MKPSTMPRSLATGMVAFLLAFLLVGSAEAMRIKDVADIQGVRSNQLVGYGLVVGLNGTGDQTSQTPFTIQSMRSMLERFGVRMPAGQNMQLRNIAAVTVSAELPPFAKPGQEIDVTVSSLGNAESLRGGTLLMTPMRAVDGQVYAMAQGNLVVGGLAAEGADGSSVTVNIPSAGRVPGGATVEKAVPTSFGGKDRFIFNLHEPDFTTAHRMVEVINERVGPNTARARDAGSVAVRAPNDSSRRVSYVSLIENLEVTPDQGKAKVVVNSRTGTVVVGRNVRVMPAAVSHGSLTVTIDEDFQTDQPAPFGEGETVVTPESEVDVEQEDAPMFVFEPGVELDSLVRAVNEVGASPSDLVAILEALKQAGALRAQFEVI